ncbi:uncharacterized protein CC84DRAFT_1249991 [Paraphaeosphaeria sporulosa]|uniref:Zn(2)-C6 fungal-type domain-containing protein n=1 Tax=Paraphaeosphaeria sporulosa TaxID=1460663 RepID=A0A177CA45_9PLEO|nr:uncharacterized protein CC84DRAFT_1249991 [Paraphaeosphaeria sporulosa]OAG04246.1 hypothetical protein CC84DRAFT_1249991 [Paraphaeosphaeria sporulosa]
MSTPTLSERPRKRRAINACILCRKSKVRCDGGRPCQRCTRNDTECQYFDAVRDGNELRIERLEAEVEDLKAAMHIVHMSEHCASNTSPHDHRSVAGSASEPQWKSPSMKANAVQAGLVTWTQATCWYQSFFSGSNYLIPVFCTSIDTLESVVSRSPFLFDCIISVGCRAEEGCNSSTYHRLQSRLREHLTDVLVTTQIPSLEMIQAITVMAGYTENGMLLVALALRFAMQLRLEDAVEQLMDKISTRMAPISDEEKQLYRLARVWHGVCNFELFFALDGGKMPATNLRTTSRRVRALVNHPSRTSTDIRLLSQVELNILRSNAYVSIARHSRNLDETSLRSTVRDTAIELSLWLEEWSTLICSDTAAPDRPRAMTNLRIQYEWALITLYLKALSVFGNLLMTDFQREMVRSAKEAAVRHLQHLLETPSTPSSPNPLSPTQPPPPTYLSTFKWAIDFVWAKCAFSVLLVLKLSLLLRDPLPSIILLLRDAHQVLEELHKITVGHIAYFQILQTSVEKCEGALREHMARLQQTHGGEGGEMTGRGNAEDDFQEYAPSEFVFEWDFPGLNLRHVPLGWQDLFVDLDSVL